MAMPAGRTCRRRTKRVSRLGVEGIEDGIAVAVNAAVIPRIASAVTGGARCSAGAGPPLQIELAVCQFDHRRVLVDGLLRAAFVAAKERVHLDPHHLPCVDRSAAAANEGELLPREFHVLTPK